MIHKVYRQFYRVEYIEITIIWIVYKLMAKEVYLALVSTQCFSDNSIALESTDFKSAGWKAASLDSLSLSPFKKTKLKTDK